MFSEIVNKSFDIWWKNKKLWIVAFIATFTISISNTQGLSASFTNYGNTIQASQVLLILSFISFIVSVCFLIYTLTIGQFASNGIVLAIGDLYHGKQIGSIKDIVKSGKKFWGRSILLVLAFMVPVAIVVGLFTFGIIMALIMSGVGVNTNDPSGMASAFAGIGITLACACCFVGIIIFFVLMLWMIIYNFAQRILILEDKGVMDSIKLSFSLVKRNFWNVIGAYIVSFAISLMILIILAIPGIILAFLFGILYATIQLSVSSISIPIVSVLFSIIYSVIIYFVISIYTGIIGSFTITYWNVVYLELKKAENHLVNGEQEKENLGAVSR